MGVEQLNWLIVGCGTNLSMDFVKDIDLIDISSISFKDFNHQCPIITDNQDNLVTQFSTCIEHIKNSLQFPQYYNGLIGLCILFYYDENYNLKDSFNVRSTFSEAHRLVKTVFEEFKDFDDSTISKLLSRLSDMSYIYTKSNVDNFKP